MIRLTEKQVEQAVITCYRAAGCFVYKLSQPRNTMQTPGVSDLYVLAPRRHCAWWHEVKTDRGKLSPPQTDFVHRNATCNMRVVVGGLSAARAHLVGLELAA